MEKFLILELLSLILAHQTWNLFPSHSLKNVVLQTWNLHSSANLKMIYTVSIIHQTCFTRKLYNYIDLQCHENNFISLQSATVLHVEDMALILRIFRPVFTSKLSSRKVMMFFKSVTVTKTARNRLVCWIHCNTIFSSSFA